MKRFILFSVIAAVLVPLTLSAGSSVFGLGPRLIGDYRYPISTAAMGRGGVSIGLVDSLGINYQNFALIRKEFT